MAGSTTMTSRQTTRSPLRTPASPRRSRTPSHPDDVLRKLARSPQQVFVPSIEFQKRRKPPTNPYSVGLWGTLGALALFAVLPWLVPNRPSISIEGMTDGEAVQPSQMLSHTVSIKTDPPSAVNKMQVTVDGIVVEPTTSDNTAKLVLGAMSEGKHVIGVRAGSRILYRGPVSKKVGFVVDSVAPTLEARLAAVPKTLEDDITIIGSSEVGSLVTVNGRKATVDPQGVFSITFPRAPIGSIQIRGTDPAGNVGVKLLPGVSGKLLPPVRGVHVSAAAWTYPPLRQQIFALIDSGQINTVQLDLKDEDGKIGHRSAVPLANQIGAAEGRYDLAAEVAILKQRGMRVVGRLVVFRDPQLAEAAWAAGQADQVLQGIDTQPYKGKYGGFTNPFNKTVRNYNQAIALEAAQAGVDDILLDYIRRPEADIQKLKFAGVEGQVDSARVSAEIVSFINDLGVTLSDTPARLGASVFGVAVAEGENIGQNIPEMSKSLDYIAPMIYPSSWTPGQLGVSDPAGQPYDIVFRSLQQFQKASAGSGTKIIPWLQDFSLGRNYGPKELRAQIIASADACIPDWLIWDPKVTYSKAGLPVGVQEPSTTPTCPAETP